jgi:DNA-binding IclR family transcriptional regulator
MDMDVKSADRILDMLEMFAATGKTMGVSHVAEKLHMQKNSTQVLLAKLADRGYLAQVGGEYVLPAELRKGSWSSNAQTRLVLLATPILRQMVQQGGESAFLTMRVGDEVQYVAKEISADEVRYDASLAHRKPIYCTSGGIVFLAQQSPAVVEAILSRVHIEAYTRDTITDRKAILRWIKRTQRDGFAETHGGFMDGLSGFAAPVFGPTGVVAAIGLGGPTPRIKRHRKRLIEMVVGQAAALSRRLSGFAAEAAGGEPQETPKTKPGRRRSTQ